MDFNYQTRNSDKDNRSYGYDCVKP